MTESLAVYLGFEDGFVEDFLEGFLGEIAEFFTVVRGYFAVATRVGVKVRVEGGLRLADFRELREQLDDLIDERRKGLADADQRRQDRSEEFDTLLTRYTCE